MSKNPVFLVVGGRRGIGEGFVSQYEKQYLSKGDPVHIVATSTQYPRPDDVDEPILDAEGPQIHQIRLDINDPDSCVSTAAWINQHFGRLDGLVSCVGMLHTGGAGSGTDGSSEVRMPERTYSEMTVPFLQENMLLNTTSAVLLAKAFVPLLSNGDKDQDPSYFACLSARIGSISDNRCDSPPPFSTWLTRG